MMYRQSTTEEAAKDIASFVAIFFEHFVKFKGRAFHMAGESYAVSPSHALEATPTYLSCFREDIFLLQGYNFAIIFSFIQSLAFFPGLLQQVCPSLLKVVTA